MVTDKLVETKLINGIGHSSILVVNIKSKALSIKVFKELDKVIERAGQFQHQVEDSKLDGIIFTSSHDKIFLAGADLYELNDLLDSPIFLREVLKAGQDVFNRIQQLDIPTVAAIHGACLGGGYELALACDYRICSDDRCTKIGLPEVNLGILPAWGGCTRLPRLIGIPKALNVILTGKQFAAKPARKLGLVDGIYHRENLIPEAAKLIRGTSKVKRPIFPSLVPTWIACRVAKKNVLKKTKGNYPAPLKIIELLRLGDSTTLFGSLSLERQYFMELATTKEMRNLLQIFFQQERSKKLTVSEKDPGNIKRATVLGAGTMGAGIAQWISSRGVDVLLKDVNEDAVRTGIKTIGKLYVSGVRGHKMDRPAARAGLARVSATSTNVPLKSTDIVIEAIVERLDIKQSVLADLEKEVSDSTIIATNTSALSIDDMASALQRPENFIGIHFFNPVHKMKLVEIVRGSKTSDSTVQRAVQFVQSIGKLPVVVKDSPGFVVNRILLPYLIDACRLYERGESPEVVDRAMVDWGMPMGPFRLMDEIGIDICHHVSQDIGTRLGWRCLPDTLKRMLEEGRLGKKTGQGFYKYNKGKSIKRSVKSTVAERNIIQIKLTVPLKAEAMRVIEDKVASCSSDVNFAMIMGTGYAPFSGGPLG